MTSIEKIAQRSGKFGWIHPDSKHFDDLEFLGDNFLNYKVTKIKIWSGKKDQKTIVNGIQFFFKSLIDGKEVTPGEYKGEQGLEKCDELVLNQNEYLVDYHVRIDTEVTQIGFTTNKGRVFKIGGEVGEDKITMIKDKGPAIILAIFGCYGPELQSCGVVYVTKKDYMEALFLGYFELKYLLKKNEEFKKATQAKESSLPQSDKVLLKACLLPDAAFNQIIKFCLI